MILVSVDQGDFKTELSKKIQSTSNPRAMLMVVGRELGNQLKSHFQKKDVTDVNKLNPSRREHFWLQVGNSVQLPVEEGNTTISVTISDPRFAQKLFGGRIIAKNARALTIPVSPDAYGRTAKTFEAETGLKLFIIKIGGTKTSNFENAVLAAHENGQKGFTVEYLLTPAVDQQADPTALPPMDVLQESLLARADSFLKNES